jgi:hypothetical protein
MNRKAHHIRLYKRLNLADSATIADLKKSYFHLANRYHPDKVLHQESSSTDVELFNDVQAAYRELKQFHDRHGHLPLSAEVDSYEQSNSPKSDLRSHRFGTISLPSYLLSGIFITLLVLLLVVPNRDDRNTTTLDAKIPTQNHPHPGSDSVTSTAPLVQHTPSRAKLQTSPITIGLPMGEVFDLLGVPDSTINNQWYYGTSEIYFRDGFVSGWNNDPKSPIWTDESLPSHVNPQPRLP